MVYARFCDGDVQVFGTWGPDAAQVFECAQCRFVETRQLNDPVFFGGRIEPAAGEPAKYVTESRADMVAHLQRHHDAGHRLPANAIERLAGEASWGKP
ncbi:hypothetical protein [Streptomyces sp. NPDC057854]|uniref:hypothetical protein n=1 Tax=unclassified Streptomyces TaxID=2593676 RepID=UPI0036A7E8F2